MNNDVNGILLLNKPSGITSFKALGSVKKQLKFYNDGSKVKVGHTGTLDCFAEGLLVVLTGKLTRLNQFFTDFDKTYEAVIEFGRQTTTLDPEGEIIKTGKIPDLDVIKDKLSYFIGKIKQRPPVFSAVHVNGERAYKKALRGELDELPEREITIYSFEITEWNPPFLKCVIHCSKGTYIRSIARDLGLMCGSCAHLSALKRTSVGPYSLSESIEPDNFNPSGDLKTGISAFKELLKKYPEIFHSADVKTESIDKIRAGMNINMSFFKDPPAKDGSYLPFNPGIFLACIDFCAGNFSYNFVG